MAGVRLAEMVASLSLATDLGLGQPQEHVLRQTVISLRIADRLGLEAEDRATLYFAALLVNVGCHSDAHEQAKWFGDDIALKSGKYEHERGLRAAAATAARRTGRARRRGGSAPGRGRLRRVRRGVDLDARW